MRRRNPLALATRWIAPSLLFLVVGVTGPCSTGQQNRPERNPVGGYTIEVSAAGGEFVTTTIGPDGEGCERFSGSEDAERTCFISKLLNPWSIGGEAYGELNDRHTPALDALIWRARANADASVCAAGGLTGPFLQECERDAVADDYEYSAGTFRVRVPIGGAQPAPAPSR